MELSCFSIFCLSFSNKYNLWKKGIINFDSDNLLPFLLQNAILVLQDIKTHQNEHFDILFAKITP